MNMAQYLSPWKICSRISFSIRFGSKFGVSLLDSFFFTSFRVKGHVVSCRVTSCHVVQLRSLLDTQVSNELNLLKSEVKRLRSKARHDVDTKRFFQAKKSNESNESNASSKLNIQ